MKILKVSLRKRSYKIIIGNKIIGFLGRYLSKLGFGPDAYVITNAFLKNKYGGILDKALKQFSFNTRFKIIPDTEKSKSMETASLIIKDLAHLDKKRQIFIVAFGGGVVGDLAGFIASIYKRGIPYVQVPTTLLAQVDSSIGGKTGIDLIQGKNLVGAFYQPRLVLSDVKILKTLGMKQIQSGLAEVIKYGIVKDAQLFGYLEKNYKDILKAKTAALEYVVLRSSYIKARIIQQDEKEEKGIRTILNFGHTIGHAIEAAGRYKKYNHGEAIGLGMLVAGDISEGMRLLDRAINQRIKNLIALAGLPTKIERLSFPEIIKAHYHDKKFVGPKNKFILIRDIGKAEVLENIPLKIIRDALKKRI